MTIFQQLDLSLRKELKSYWSKNYSTPTANPSLPHDFAFEPIKEDFFLRQLKQFRISARLVKDSASVISGSLSRSQLAPFLRCGNSEKLQHYSRKGTAVMQTITGPLLSCQR